jgi:hypothetical protein
LSQTNSPIVSHGLDSLQGITMVRHQWQPVQAPDQADGQAARPEWNRTLYPRFHVEPRQNQKPRATMALLWVGIRQIELEGLVSLFRPRLRYW